MANFQNDNQNINSKDFLIGTLVGGLIGVSVAMLCTPKPGKEIRESLSGNAGTVKERATEWKEKAAEKSQNISGKVPFRNRSNSSEAEAERAAEEVARAIEEAADELEREEDPRTTGL